MMEKTYVVLSSREIVRGIFDTQVSPFFAVLIEPEIYFRTLPNGLSIAKFLENTKNEVNRIGDANPTVWRPPSTRMVIPTSSILYMQSDIEQPAASE